jgi:hypothetical protein
MFHFLRSLWKDLILDPPKPVRPAESHGKEPATGPAAGSPGPPPAAGTPQDDARVDGAGYPPSHSISKGSPNNPRPDVFDPALRQYARAFRHGDPTFADAELESQWRLQRQVVIDHILSAVADSPWRSRLVLRGSVLLKAWFGDEARAPGDIDWLVVPPSWKLGGRESRELLEGLARMLCAMPDPEGIKIFGDRLTAEDIWTYERAPGRRIVLPWRADGLEEGTIQMDLVFGEPMIQDPELIDYRTCEGRTFEGRTVKLLAATPELSLVWKLVWLETDVDPQGKDLYDAVLPARRVTPSFDLLHAALQAAEDDRYIEHADFPMRWQLDWDNFVREYPEVRGTAAEWQRELTDRLAPMFQA